MKLASLQDVFGHSGPFVTVYLDTSAAEDAAKAIELRWHSARERLVEQGADEETLSTIAEQIGSHERETGNRGQVLVATQGQVVLNDELPQPPDKLTDDAYCGALPQLMPYLLLRGPHIPHVVAVIDHVGADVTIVHANRKPETRTVEGTDHPVHKARAGAAGSEERIQNTVEEEWKHNASKVAAEITADAESIHARAIVLAGDPQQRKLVHERLSTSVQDRVVETGTGHRDRKSSGDTLREEVAKTVQTAIDARITEAVREFEQERGREDRAVEGWDATLAAFREERVRALLWAPSSSGRPENVYIGPKAGELSADEKTLRELGTESVGKVPADAAVIRALAGTSGEFFPVDSDRVELTDGIGGILRF